MEQFSLGRQFEEQDAHTVEYSKNKLIAEYIVLIAMKI